MSAAAGTHMQSVYWSDSYTFRQKEILCRIGKRRELSPGNRLSVCFHEIKAVRTTDPAVGTSCLLHCSSSRLLFLLPFFPSLIFFFFWKISNLPVLSTEMLMKLRIYFVFNFKNLIKGGLFCCCYVFFSSGKRRNWKFCHLLGHIDWSFQANKTSDITWGVFFHVWVLGFVFVFAFFLVWFGFFVKAV